MWVVVGWWRAWKAVQALPYAGLMADQPAYVYEGILACELEAQRAEAAQTKRAHEEAAKSWLTPPK